MRVYGTLADPQPVGNHGDFYAALVPLTDFCALRRCDVSALSEIQIPLSQIITHGALSAIAGHVCNSLYAVAVVVQPFYIVSLVVIEAWHRPSPAPTASRPNQYPPPLL